MKKKSISVAFLAIAVFTIVGFAMDSPSDKSGKNLALQLETKDKEAEEVLKRNAIKPATLHKMPYGCVTTSSSSIDNGKILFNNLNNANGKFAKYDNKKLFGNCIACHEIEKGEGYGNIGPSLKKYNETYVKSGARTPEWIYQKIADSRIDNKDTVMTINLTTGLMSEREICDIVSYLVSNK